MHRGHASEDLLFAARTDDQGCSDVRSCGERNAAVRRSTPYWAAAARSFSRDVFTWDVPRIRSVVVTWTAGDEPGVQGRADHEFDISLSRHRKNVVDGVGMVGGMTLDGHTPSRRALRPLRREGSEVEIRAGEELSRRCLLVCPELHLSGTPCLARVILVRPQFHLRLRKSPVEIASANNWPPIIEKYFDWPPIRDPAENSQALVEETAKRM